MTITGKCKGTLKLESQYNCKENTINLWTPLSSHILYSSRKKPDTHLPGWHLRVLPFVLVWKGADLPMRDLKVMIGCFKQQCWSEKSRQCLVCSQMLDNLIKNGQALVKVISWGHLLNQLRINQSSSDTFRVSELDKNYIVVNHVEFPHTEWNRTKKTNKTKRVNTFCKCWSTFIFRSISFWEYPLCYITKIKLWLANIHISPNFIL